MTKKRITIAMSDNNDDDWDDMLAKLGKLAESFAVFSPPGGVKRKKNCTCVSNPAACKKQVKHDYPLDDLVDTPRPATPENGRSIPQLSCDRFICPRGLQKLNNTPLPAIPGNTLNNKIRYGNDCWMGNIDEHSSHFPIMTNSAARRKGYKTNSDQSSAYLDSIACSD